MEATSLGDMLRRSCLKWTDRTAMQAPGKKGFSPITYTELYKIVHRYASALQEMGAQRGDRLAILSENAPEWAFTDWACQTLGVIVVPIYPTLPADQAQYIARDAGATIAVVGTSEQAKKLEGLEGLQVRLLKGEGSLDERAGEVAPIPLQEWEEGIAGTGLDDVATIIYTSGTTGLPKGAMLAHRGFLVLFHEIVRTIPVDERDVFLCFLPMAHVYERVDGQGLPISLGATIAYAKNLASLAGDITLVKPTVILAVPRFLEATMAKILDGVRKGPPIRQKLFSLALSQGKRHFKGEFAPLYFLTNRLVGSKIRVRLGGRLRFFVSGGAALPRHVAEFYGAFDLKILQGYGLTETYSGVCINHPERNRYETVGEPIPGVEVKIADDGEILFRGAARMLGYWNLPQETAEAIDPEGWFHTGDIGEFDGPYLRITDRKKDLLVLGNGKNVAPQPIENRLRESPLIEEAVVLGDGMDACVALIVPDFDAIRARVEGLSKADNATIAASEEARKAIRKEIDAVNKTLAPFEMVKKHALLERGFSIDSGELTPSFKVKRKVVKERYATQISSLS